MKGMLSPSLMCADPLNLQADIETLDALGVEYIHLDFMDNKFVPNITLDANLVKAVKGVLRNMKRDIHIMAYEPQQFFERMDIGSGDIVSVHYEACEDLHAVIAAIRQTGASPFVAISPDTAPEVLADYLGEVDGVVVMTVYPGFAGRPIVEGSFKKLAAVREMLDNSGRDILLEVDGHVSWELCQKMRQCGVDLFVAGSSSIYAKGLDLKDSVPKMMALIQ